MPSRGEEKRNRKGGLDWPSFLGFPQRSGCLGKAVAKIGWDPLLNDFAQESRKRGGDSDQNPQKRREHQSGDRNRLERNRHGVRLVKVKLNLADMGDELNPVDNHRGKKEGNNRQRADRDQQNIDRPSHPLTVSAMAALGKMLFIVRSHSRRKTGDIVTPAGENRAHNLIVAAGGAIVTAIS
ncbi:hypothetical protein BDD14_4242 [Edaphobacter modestus]|uniref:Uncharacterized protein n=1 Tax=Edaphobacter modestus TaxID=388466 RepID=A0A4Q7YZD8_9BACT|nr:hypothetical protein BDD14_4242 [Edaphobacter modestus]